MEWFGLGGTRWTGVRFRTAGRFWLTKKGFGVGLGSDGFRHGDDFRLGDLWTEEEIRLVDGSGLVDYFGLGVDLY